MSETNVKTSQAVCSLTVEILTLICHIFMFGHASSAKTTFDTTQYIRYEDNTVLCSSGESYVQYIMLILGLSGDTGWRRVYHQGTEDSEAYGYPGRYTRGASLSANNKEGEYTLDAANVLCLASYRLSG